ncbi:MAG: SDR family NAD(P)-dependent oxidoreductase [Pseudomonadota bacterium]
MNLDQRVIIVTGAGGNLGAATAKQLAKDGALLALADMTQAHLDAVAQSLEARHPPLLIAGADVRTHDGCARIADETQKHFGKIDALANTVGTFQMAAVEEGAADQWQLLMELNALSALRLSAAVAPAMKAQKYGRIVHVAAGAGLKAFAGASVYSASKAALIRITEAFSEEHKSDGICANCIMPSTIDTPQNRAAMPKADTSKWVQPEAIAKVIAFLVSADAEAITGAAIPVFGRG